MLNQETKNKIVLLPNLTYKLDHKGFLLQVSQPFCEHLKFQF